MVGDPGIEPGVGRPEGVTVPCHTLRPIAHHSGVNTGPGGWRQLENGANVPKNWPEGKLP